MPRPAVATPGVTDEPGRDGQHVDDDDVLQEGGVEAQEQDVRGADRRERRPDEDRRMHFLLRLLRQAPLLYLQSSPYPFSTFQRQGHAPETLPWAFPAF